MARGYRLRDWPGPHIVDGRFEEAPIEGRAWVLRPLLWLTFGGAIAVAIILRLLDLDIPGIVARLMP